MRAKASIYKDKDCDCNDTLLFQMRNAVDNLEEAMRATIPISKAGHHMGWGVDKSQRGIAADSVISIAKAIKSLKGW